MVLRISDIFINHLEKHSVCFGNTLLYFRWIHFSPKALQCAMKLIDPLIIIFQKRILMTNKNFPDQYRTDEIKSIVLNSLRRNQTFESNLNLYMSKHFQYVF